jgi:DNA replication initiation complex subunit (GINS family)
LSINPCHVLGLIYLGLINYEMISYPDLEKTYRLERASPTLNRIAEDFFDEARALAANPQAASYKDSINDYIEKIYYLRSNKIIHYAGRAASETKPPDNILAKELELYTKIIKVVDETKAALLERIIDVAPVVKPVSLVRVRIKQAMPAIVGADSVEYGPFREDDEVELPEENANILIAHKVAEKA